MMTVVADTNVAVVANGLSEQVPVVINRQKLIQTGLTQI